MFEIATTKLSLPLFSCGSSSSASAEKDVFNCHIIDDCKKSTKPIDVNIHVKFIMLSFLASRQEICTFLAATTHI